jgi:DNA-binding CsgD family transcriptional regulator
MSEEFSRTLEAIYDAVTETGRWGSAVAAVVEYVGAQAGLLLFCEINGPCLPLATVGLHVEAAASEEPWLGIARATEATLAGCAPGSILRIRLTPRRATRDTAPLVALAKESGLHDALGALLLRDGDFVAGLWLFHGTPEVPGARADVRLSKVMNHLQRAVSVQYRIEKTEGRAAASWQAFERVVLAAVVVDRESRPLLVNRAAKRLAAQNDGFAIAEGGLGGLSVVETRAMRAAVLDVVNGRARSGVALSLPRRSGGRPYEVMVLPARRTSWWAFHHRPSAIVFISELPGARSGLEGFVRELYGLTTAEARLALLLLGGQGLAEAATALGITRNTAHSQLSSIFRKTHTASQAELVRVLLAGPAAVRPPGDTSIGHTPTKVN